MSKFCFSLYAPPTTNRTWWKYEFINDDVNAASSNDKKTKTDNLLEIPNPPPLEAGRYRFHCNYSRVDADIRIQRDATPEDEPIEVEFTTTDMVRPERYGLPRRVVDLEHGKVVLLMQSDVPSVFRPWVFRNLTDEEEKIFFHKDHEPYVTAVQALHVPCFSRLFGSQVVSDITQFVVQRVTLVFTDVVSSTQLYEEAGDGRALQCVKDHFQILFSAFLQHGRIVKTIGDAVMGAFTSPSAALLATAKALDEIEAVKRPNGESLQIRIGVHTGSALMVALNGTNDYFGSTVNIAARVESKASGGECLVSQSVFENDPAALDLYERVFLNEEGRYVREDASLLLKGVDGEVRVRAFGRKGIADQGKRRSSVKFDNVKQIIPLEDNFEEELPVEQAPTSGSQNSDQAQESNRRNSGEDQDIPLVVTIDLEMTEDGEVWC